MDNTPIAREKNCRTRDLWTGISIKRLERNGYSQLIKEN